jgi:hypothetical protein
MPSRADYGGREVIALEPLPRVSRRFREMVESDEDA